MKAPKLRFKADDGSKFPDWEEKVFGDFVDTHLEKTSDKDTYPLYSLTIESGVQPKTDRYEREFLVKKEGDNYKIVPPNAFVYNPMNLRFGALKVNHEKFSVSVSGYYDVFSLKDDSVLAFWENYLVTPKMLNYYFSIATGSLIEKLRVHYSQFVKIKKPLPSLQEQQKIAEFLSTIDTVIEKQKETVSAWEERKKGVMQKLFSQEVRFKADDGSQFPDWEEKKLSEMFKKIIEKDRLDLPPLTIVQGYGTIRRDKSERRITYDEKGLRNYKAVQKDDFIVHLRSFEGGLEIANLDGMVRPAYHVYRRNSKIYPPFYYPYFRSSSFIKSKLATCVSGVRDGKNIEKESFDELLIPYPCLAEQQKIADCLSSLDDVIAKQKATLATWEELKKGLLQQMFI